jgi:hypothetical protein
MGVLSLAVGFHRPGLAGGWWPMDGGGPKGTNISVRHERNPRAGSPEANIGRR